MPTNTLLGKGSHMAKPKVDMVMYSLPTQLEALQSHMTKGMMFLYCRKETKNWEQ